MFKQKTTIVVGAGASCELGLPSGDLLKAQIVSLFAPTEENMYGLKNEALINAVRGRLQSAYTPYGGGSDASQSEIAEIKSAAKRINRGLPLALSIDNFLHTHQDDLQVVQLGKTAIAMSILDAERKCALFASVSPVTAQQMVYQRRERLMDISSERMEKSWYPPFVQLLMSGYQRRSADTVFANLRFIVFNYDRCLEQYLWLALQAYFDLTSQEAGDILQEVEFIHPYGSLGLLPWQTDDAGSVLRFGKADDVDFWRVGSRIRTFTESVTSDLKPRIKSAIEDPTTIILLGFGYLDQNVQLLMPSERRNAQRVMSTAYGTSIDDQQLIKEMLVAFTRLEYPQIMIESGTCREFFDKFRLHLSLR